MPAQVTHADSISDIETLKISRIECPLAKEMRGDYPITNDHGSILYQLCEFKRLHPHVPAPLVLNFDPHHDFYEEPDFSSLAVLSGTWARAAHEMQLARVYTVLPCRQTGNRGGFGKHTWEAPQVVQDLSKMSQIDYQATMGYNLGVETVCELRDLKIPTNHYDELTFAVGATMHQPSQAPLPGHDKSPWCSLARYAGPIWLSIDYDFFSRSETTTTIRSARFRGN